MITGRLQSRSGQRGRTRARYGTRVDADVFAKALVIGQERATTLVSLVEQMDFLFLDDVDIAPESVIVEATGTEAEVDALVALLRGYGIKELVRTGAVVMLRGAGSIEEQLKWEGPVR